MKHILKLIICMSFLGWSLPSIAQNNVIEAFTEDMVNKHGFDRAQLMQWFSQAKVLNTVLKLTAPSSNKHGKPRPWYLYRKNFVTPFNINSGVEFWSENVETLRRAEQIYGVPAQIILGILGVETIYGRQMGNFRIIDTLVTLGFYHPTRAAYFREELEHFLLMTRDAGIDPFRIRGSYAGAMGMAQFMPSSFRKYAVDFDGDGKVNLWSSPADAIGSVANYFRQYGWQSGQAIIAPVKIRENATYDFSEMDMKPEYTLSNLREMGILYTGNEPDETLGTIVELDFSYGPTYWLAFQNFYVITRYNHSRRYAMSVYELGQEIARHYAQGN